jgi:maltose/moltooligosaccharide transporter
MEKRKLSFWEIWNMSFGFLGIQFGFALQGGFMSRIFQTLGAAKDDIPMLWIAAPLTGLIVQPIIGYLSDRTWHSRLGRRRPYFLIGAILSSLALFFVPHSPALWMAAGFLWILDASINISMEPFRALVADKLTESQRSYGFVVQTLIIGIGTWVASNLPWMISKLGVSDAAATGVVPMSVKVAFAIGAFVFMISILYTIFTTTEYPPEDMEEFEREKKQKNRFIPDILENIGSMPTTMKRLGVIQFFSWFAFFTMWSMANPALTEHVFNTPNPTEEVYEKAEKNDRFKNTNTSAFLAIAAKDSVFVKNAIKDTLIADATIAKEVLTSYSALKSESEKLNYLKTRATSFQSKKVWYWVSNDKFQKSSNLVGSYMGTYGLSSMVFALVLVLYTSRRRINRKFVHMGSLILGGIGFIMMYFVPSPDYLFISFILIGFAWGSILSMPYAMLSSSVDPKKMGVIMGIFNMFIVIPQIIAALGGINFITGLFGEGAINAMILAGVSLIIAGLCNFLITNKNAISYQTEES